MADYNFFARAAEALQCAGKQTHSYWLQCRQIRGINPHAPPAYVRRI